MNKQQKKQRLQTTHIYIHISCKCDTNRAGHFTLDAHASRPVACFQHSPYSCHGWHLLIQASLAAVIGQTLCIRLQALP